MKLTATRAIVTGATGGIGLAVSAELLRRGASVLLVGRNHQALEKNATALGGRASRLDVYAADLTSPTARAGLCRHATYWQGGGINTLVNNAGTGDFGLIDDVTDASLEQMFAINVLTPIQLCRDLLPHLRQQRAAAILNMGSVFGSLGYPGFAAYSATKFALRGFTEALAREMSDTSVRVHYLAPRSTRTGMNSSAVERLNAELKVSMDTPQRVATAACDMLEQGRRYAVVGWPEKFFVRVNALLPRIVDGSLAKQLPVIRRHARDAASERNAGTAGNRRAAPISYRGKTAMNAIHIATCTSALLLTLGSAYGSPAPVAATSSDPAFDSELRSIQQAWARVNYEMPKGASRTEAFDALEKRAESFTHQHPKRPEALIWEGIIESSYAGAKGGLGALSLCKEARGNLEQALKLDPTALEGSAYTSLGTLYHKVPAFPFGFGDNDKAAQLLQKALQLNPNGIDPNYFYAEYLYDKGQYAQAMPYLDKASNAAPRPGRESADAGRRGEIAALRQKVQAKLG